MYGRHPYLSAVGGDLGPEDVLAAMQGIREGAVTMQVQIASSGCVSSMTASESLPAVGRSSGAAKQPCELVITSGNSRILGHLAPGGSQFARAVFEVGLGKDALRKCFRRRFCAAQARRDALSLPVD